MKRLPLNKAKALARAHPALVGVVLLVLVLTLLWAVMIAIAVPAYSARARQARGSPRP